MQKIFLPASGCKYLLSIYCQTRTEERSTGRWWQVGWGQTVTLLISGKLWKSKSVFTVVTHTSPSDVSLSLTCKYSYASNNVIIKIIRKTLDGWVRKEKYHMCHQNIALIWALEYHFFSQKQNGLNLLEMFLSAASYFEMKYDKSSKIDNMCTSYILTSSLYSLP